MVWWPLIAVAWSGVSDVALRLPDPLPVQARAGSWSVDPDRLEADLGVILGRPARDVRVARRGDRWFADVPVVIDGVPVFRGDTGVRGVSGRAGLVIERPIDGVPSGQFALTPGEAVDRLRARVGASAGIGTARRVWAPGLRAAWEVGLEQPDAHWLALVDAEHGSVLALWSEHAWLTGSVTGDHHARGVDGAPLVTSPLPLVRVIGDAGETFADETGVWDLATALPVTVTLAGAYATVNDRQDVDLAWVSDTASVEVASAPDQSEIDAYVHVHTVRAWGQRVWPDNGFVTDPIELDVDQALAGCNAFFLGRVLHFYRPVGTCWPPAQHADVVFHEWGHGLHFHGRQAGIFDLALSEGISDLVAWWQTRDPVIARGLFKDGTGFRDLSVVKRYPDDYLVDDAHASGWIIGGAGYDLAWILEAELGEAGAAAAFEPWFVNWLAAGPEVATAYAEALAADDDDGNLGNGTPHDCALTMAFGRHGYGPLADGWSVAADHEPPQDVVAGLVVPLAVSLTASPDPCLDRAVDDAVVSWTLDGVAQPDLVASAAGAGVEAELPALAAGSVVTYRFEGALFDGTGWRSPETGTWSFEVAAGEGGDTGPVGGGPGGDGGAKASGGCGCDGSGGSGPGWLVVGLVAAIARPRTRGVSSASRGLAAAVLLAGCADDGPGSVGTGAPTVGTSTGSPTGSSPTLGPAGPPAADLTLDRVELNPGVPLLAWSDGDEVDPGARTAVVPRDRPLLVRVYATPTAGSREYEGRLVVTPPGAEPVELAAFATPRDDPGSLDATFSFDVPGEVVVPGASFLVSLHEVDGPGGAAPVEATGDLGVDPDPLVLRVVVVPLEYDRDGCTATPDLSGSVLTDLEDALFQQNPVSSVELQAHEPLPFAGDLKTSTGVYNAMIAAWNLRADEDPPPDVYYYALFDNCGFCVKYTPEATECFRGISMGVLGDTQGEAGLRAASGQLDDRMGWTFTHEIGHLQGRSHVACPFFDAGGTDGTYPYAEGRIARWGYGVRDGVLRPPDDFDYMANCQPSWVSDWQWAATAERIRTLSSW